MSEYFTDFQKALQYFRDVGGVMNVHFADTEVWEVKEHPEKLAERSTCTPRKATEFALACGGMSVKEIAKELKDRQ